MVAFVLLLIAAYIPAKLTEWILGRILGRWLGTLPWLGGAFEILKSALLPVLAWGLGSVTSYAFEPQGWATGILAWLLPLLPVWMIYRLAKTAVYLALPADRTRRLHRRLVLPLTLVLVVLHIAGALTSFWDYRAEVLPGARNVVSIFMRAFQPLIAWILGMAVLALYGVLGVDSAFSAWAVSFFLLWFLYEVVQAYLALHLAPAHGRRAIRVLQIVVVVLAGLHSVDPFGVVWGGTSSSSSE